VREDAQSKRTNGGRINRRFVRYVCPFIGHYARMRAASGGAEAIVKCGSLRHLPITIVRTQQGWISLSPLSGGRGRGRIIIDPLRVERESRREEQSAAILPGFLDPELAPTRTKHETRNESDYTWQTLWDVRGFRSLVPMAIFILARAYLFDVTIRADRRKLGRSNACPRFPLARDPSRWTNTNLSSECRRSRRYPRRRVVGERDKDEGQGVGRVFSAESAPLRLAAGSRGPEGATGLREVRLGERTK